MKRETTKFERAYTAKVNGLGLLLLVIHVPALYAVAALLGKNILPANRFGSQQVTLFHLGARCSTRCNVHPELGIWKARESIPA